MQGFTNAALIRISARSSSRLQRVEQYCSDGSHETLDIQAGDRFQHDQEWVMAEQRRNQWRAFLRRADICTISWDGQKSFENLDFIDGQAEGLVLMDGLFGVCDAAVITKAGS